MINSECKTDSSVVLKQQKTKVQRKNNRKKLDVPDQDHLYFVSDKDELEVVQELGLCKFNPLFD